MWIISDISTCSYFPRALGRCRQLVDSSRLLCREAEVCSQSQEIITTICTSLKATLCLSMCLPGYLQIERSQILNLRKMIITLGELAKFLPDIPCEGLVGYTACYVFSSSAISQPLWPLCTTCDILRLLSSP